MNNIKDIYEKRVDLLTESLRLSEEKSKILEEYVAELKAENAELLGICKEQQSLLDKYESMHK